MDAKVGIITPSKVLGLDGQGAFVTKSIQVSVWTII